MSGASTNNMTFKIHQTAITQVPARSPNNTPGHQRPSHLYRRTSCRPIDSQITIGMVVSNGSQRLTKEEVHIAFEGNIESSRLDI